MHHTIKRDIVIDNRELRNSFRRAVDRSYDSDTTPRPTGDEEEGEQRGVDGECVCVCVGVGVGVQV